MKCLTVSASRVSVGLPLAHEPYPHVAVGEKGRGRTLARFPVGRQLAEALAAPGPCPSRGQVIYADPCPRCGQAGTQEAYGWRHPDAGLAPQEELKVSEASVLRTKERGTLLLVEERDPADRRAVVLLAVRAGFRGTTSVTAATYEEVPCRHQGQAVLSLLHARNGRCSECGVDGVYTEDLYYFRHPAAGVRRRYGAFPPAGVAILTQGLCAQGDAGRMGGHAEYLLLMETGARVRVVRHGRLYGAPAERIVVWDGETLRLGTADEIDPPADVPVEGELI